MTIVIELMGEVVAKGRPRVAYRGQTPIVYTPSKTRKYELELKLVASQQMAGRDLLEGPLRMRVDVELPIMRSWPKKKQRMAAAGTLRPIKRPDLDNYWKTAADSLNLVVFHDDSQIVDILCSKRYGSHPKIRIEIEEVL